MNSTRSRLFLTALVALAELAHLAWEHFHGGIVRHHLLNRADLPAISNAWGAILLPMLTWFLVGRIQSRLASRRATTNTGAEFPLHVFWGFFSAVLLGVSLAIAFVSDNEAVASYLFYGMLVLALLLPVYRAECVLGFVLAMTLTFGAILPALIACVIAAVSATVHLGLIPLAARLWARTRSP